jgi:hypothetical protein
VAADQAAGEHAIGRYADTERAAGRQDAVLDAAREQGIFDLEIADRMNRRRAADGGAADLREADVADMAGLHQVGDGAHRVLDRH